MLFSMYFTSHHCYHCIKYDRTRMHALPLSISMFILEKSCEESEWFWVTEPYFYVVVGRHPLAYTSLSINTQSRATVCA